MPPTIDRPDGRGPISRLRALDGTGRLLATATLLSLAGIWILFAIIVRASYVEQKRDASDYAGNVAALIASDLGNVFEAYDLSLQALVTNLADPAVRRLPPALRPKVLFDNSTNASIFGAMVVVDGRGIVTEDSRHSMLNHIDVSDRDYFRAQKDGASPHVFLSRPYRSRITGEEMVGISRRLDSDGHFDGVALGTLRLSALRDLFAKAHLPPGSTIALHYRDGRELTSLVLNGAGERDDPASSDPQDDPSPAPPSLVVGRPVSGLPLEQTVSIPMTAVLATFWQRTLATAAGFSLLSAIIVALGVTLTRELARRAVAEAALRRLATTDALTGLVNRGRFDELLRGEIERSRRTRRPLALLVLDVDYFKAFNDTYGHAGGDAALRAVGEVLFAQRVRQSDVVARIGGEEFAVLMPDTDLAGAARLAERIQAALRSRAVPHAGSPLAVLTISIGMASRAGDALPTAAADVVDAGADDAAGAGGPSPAALFEEADAALYRAKRDGRNTTRGPTGPGVHGAASMAA